MAWVAPASTTVDAALVSPVRLAVTSQPGWPTAATDRVTSWAVSLLNWRSNVNDESAAPVRAGVDVVRLDVAGRLGIDPDAHGQDVGRAAAPAGHPDLAGRRGRVGRDVDVEPDGAVGVVRDGHAVDDVAATEQAGRPAVGHAGQVQRDVRVADRGDGQVERDLGAGRDGHGRVGRRDLEAVIGGDGRRREQAEDDGRGDQGGRGSGAPHDTRGQGNDPPGSSGPAARGLRGGGPRTAGAKSLSNGRNLPHRLA